MRTLPLTAIMLTLAVACSSNGSSETLITSTATPTIEPTTTSTPEPAHTAPPRPTPTPTPSIEHIGPLEESAEPEVAEAGLVVFDLAAGTSWRSVGEVHAQPIRFEGETLVARFGDDVVRLDRTGEIVETLPGVGVTPLTDPNAPGLRGPDHDRSPDLRYAIERVDTRTATGTRPSQSFYDLVLIDLEAGTRTTVMREQLRCQCDSFAFGAWSKDGRYIDYGVDRTVIVEVEERTASIVLPDERVSWSLRGELFGWSRSGISIDGSNVLDVGGELQHTDDGNYFSVTFFTPAGGSNGFAVYHRRGLAPVLEGAGRIADLASNGSTVVAVLRDVPGCEFGVALVGTNREPLCFDGASVGSLSADGGMVAIHYGLVDLGRSPEDRTIIDRVETFSVVNGQRRAVLNAPSLPDARSGVQVFLLWSDDGTQLAIYWPWVYGV